MENALIKERPLYTKGEEIFNAVSHIAGGGIGVVIWIVMLVFAYPSTWKMLDVSIFGISVITLYTMSALYHFLRPVTAKKVFRIFDHCTIFLLIAGTYTPFCTIVFGGTGGTVVLIAEWVLAAVGITMNAIAMNNKWVKGISMALYVIMGWAALGLYYVFPLLDPLCLKLLIAGGLMYSGGITFFAFGKKVRYFHSIWHLFDIFGTLLQFFSLMVVLSA